MPTYAKYIAAYIQGLYKGDTVQQLVWPSTVNQARSSQGSPWALASTGRRRGGMTPPQPDKGGAQQLGWQLGAGIVPGQGKKQEHSKFVKNF